jgi:hypothetical protein
MPGSGDPEDHHMSDSRSVPPSRRWILDRWSAQSRHLKSCLIVAVGTVFLLFIWSVVGSHRGALWLQTFAGNWSPPNPELSDYEFAAAAFIAVALNLGAIIVLASGLYKIIMLERKMKMDLASALVIKELDIREELYNSLPDALNLTQEQKGKLVGAVEGAFVRGSETWAQSLLKFGVDPQQIFGMLTAEAARQRSTT